MEVGKSPFYNWMMVLLISAGIVVIAVVSALWNERIYRASVTSLGAYIFLSVIPILISRSKSRSKNYYGYGIPAFLLLPTPYFIYIIPASGCILRCGGHGFSSALVGSVALILLGSAAAIFAISYAMGLYFKNRTLKFVLFLAPIIIPISVAAIVSLVWGLNWLLDSLLF